MCKTAESRYVGGNDVITLHIVVNLSKAIIGHQ